MFTAREEADQEDEDLRLDGEELSVATLKTAQDGFGMDYLSVWDGKSLRQIALVVVAVFAGEEELVAALPSGTATT